MRLQKNNKKNMFCSGNKVIFSVYCSTDPYDRGLPTATPRASDTMLTSLWRPSWMQVTAEALTAARKSQSFTTRGSLCMI